jgi:prepilin-type N-terminal cleavage/methylation domain-containing protein
MFKPKLPQQEQGFTLVEVLVAVLLTTVFVATAMQAVVIAAFFKTRARQYAEATTWIQQDLESVKQQADILGVTTLTAVPTANLLPVSSTTGFVAGNRLKVGTISTTFYTISSNPSSNTIPVTPALTPAQISATPVGSFVSVVAMGSTDTTLCYANAANSQTNRFGEFLSNNLLPVPSETSNTSTPNIGTKKIAGKPYTLSRTRTVRPVAPFDVLKITYTVDPIPSPPIPKPIAKLNTEVIPNAALQCPP